MFKTFYENHWNPHTPAYLHPYTKENLVWQLKLTGVVILGMVVYGVAVDAYDSRKYKKARLAPTDH